MKRCWESPNQNGAALIFSLIALAVVTLLGLFMTLHATTGLRISDNHESRVHADYAALAGLNHARALLRGLAFGDLLKGPDGAYDGSALYMKQARSFAFRNPLSLATAHSLDILDPSADISGIADDGLMNTGYCGGINGTVLIPPTGIPLTAPDPYGAGTLVTARYFVKVTDNNGDPSEIAGDPDDNPFADGDGTVIVRSMGVARTMSESIGPIWRRNSVVIYEGRYKRRSTLNLGPAMVILADGLEAVFGGMYEVSGGLDPGIGVVDTDAKNTVSPAQIIRDAAGEGSSVTGGGLPSPSVKDLTGSIPSDPDRSLLVNPGYLWDFLKRQAPRMCDSYYEGNQNWSGGSAPFAGIYDPARPANDPDQDPRMIMVNGDLDIAGGFSGGGLLIVTGRFSYSGEFAYNGLILVIGAGRLFASGTGTGLNGALLLANLTETGGKVSFGPPAFAIEGESRITANRDAVGMAVGLISPSQISFREIAGLDP
jgi:hypothetical protein